MLLLSAIADAKSIVFDELVQIRDPPTHFIEIVGPIERDAAQRGGLAAPAFTVHHSHHFALKIGRKRQQDIQALFNGWNAKARGIQLMRYSSPLLPAALRPLGCIVDQGIRWCFARTHPKIVIEQQHPMIENSACKQALQTRMGSDIALQDF